MDQAITLRGAKLMQIAKRRLMIKPASSGLSLYESVARDGSVRIIEQAIQVLDRLIRLCNSRGGSKNVGSLNTASLKFNHAQCRFLDLQSFHDNLRNLADEMASLDPASCDQCKVAAMEIAKVTRNAEALVFCWVSTDEEEGENSWLVKAILSAGDDGVAAVQQRQDQQWCVSVLEVVLAQFRAHRDDSSKHSSRKVPTSSLQHQVPYWMIDRTFEIAEEYLFAETDRGLVQAVRLDRKILLEKLRKLKQKYDGFFFRGLSSVFSSRNRKNASIRIPELTSYLIAKMDADDEEIESFIEKLHEREAWSRDIVDDNVDAAAKRKSNLLGTGRFGSVERSDFLGFPAAVKVTSVYSPDSFWNEVSVLASVRHPRIAQLIYATTTEEEAGECRLWTELLGTNLHTTLDTLQKMNQVPAETVAVEIMLQVAEGMAFLHKRGVLHRHLNAFNVLLVPKQSKSRKKYSNELDEFVKVKITDFGLPKTKLAGRSFLRSRDDDDGDEEQQRFHQQQLPFWQAPEVFQQASPEITFTKKSDVFSFGMLCYQVLSCRRPFCEIESLTESLLFRLLSVERVRPDILPHSPAYLAALIQKCWIHEPEKRPSFAQICVALRCLKGLMTRRQPAVHRNILPLTPSDFSHLFSVLGLNFFVRTIFLHKKKQQRKEAGSQSLFLMLLDEEAKRPERWPFPVDSFVLWLSNSVEQLQNEDGFGAAAEITGDLMANWLGASHDFEQAVFWYYKASSCKDKAKGGSARWKFGMCLEDGLGIAKDEKRAFGIYKQAAREGSASAFVEVGRCYQTGKGVEVCNADKAVANYAKALEMAEDDDDDRQGNGVECVDFLLKVMAKAAREEDCVWAGERIQEIAAKSRVGRMVAAGRECCNVRELVGMLGDWGMKEIGRKKAKLLLERLAIEDDILQKALLA